MAYTITNTERENHGSVDAVYATVDITSLANAGNEPFDVGAALGLEDAANYGVAVRGTESDAYLVRYDHLNGQFHVQNAADATDVTAGTAVGEVVIEAVGA